MWSLVAVAASTLVLWLYFSWARARRYWAERGVPHDPPHPLLGSLTFLQRENPGIFMRDLYARFKAPYVGIWLFWRPALVVNCPELGRRILVSDFDSFRNRFLGSGSATADPIGGQGLFTVKEPVWSKVRKRLSPVFTTSKLRALHRLKLSKARELAQRVTNDLQQGNEIELRSLFSDFTTDVIGAAEFGVECGATLSGASPIRTVTRDFMKFDRVRGLAWTSIFYWPELVKFFRFSLFPKHSVAYFRKLFKNLVETATPGESDGTLLAALLKMKQDADANGEEMDNDLLIAQAAIFLQGGFDTSASLMAFLTYELAYQPETQDILYEELMEAKKKLDGKDFDAETLSELPYLNSVIKEALRLYPGMGWLDRIAVRDYKVDERLTIAAGTPVYVNAVGLHYDAALHPQPRRFKADRFLPRNEANMTPHTFMPFGDGPRMCIGWRFANHTMWYAMAYLLMSFELRPKTSVKLSAEDLVDKRSLFFMPGEPLYVDFVPRK